MRRTIIAQAVAGVLLLGAGVAQADVGVGVRGGLYGVVPGFGLELSTGISERVNARVGYYTGTFTQTGTEYSQIKYDASSNLNNFAFMADWHPFAGSFRLTGGYVSNASKLTLTAQPTSSYNIGGTTYTSSEVGTLTGELTLGSGGYLGMGWGNAGKGKGFGISFEVGALFTSPSFTSHATGLAASDPTFQANLATETKQTQDELSSYKVLPQIAFGINYTF